MAKNTPNYEFEKPKQNDFYDVDVQNRNWDKAETALTEFDDYGSVDEIKSFPDFLKKFVTGNKLAVTMRNLKAGMQFVLHAGQIVNNCVTDNAGLPLSAAQGKALMDKYTQLYSESKKVFITRDHPYNDILFVNENVYGFMSCSPNTKNLPIATYGMALTCKDPAENWIFVFFLPTSLESLYVNFYNRYDGANSWTGWHNISFTKTKS